ncbi:MAG: citramalate synthase [Anaerolineaceae bacterium]|jgi:2-isopropylmalate synthase|nr:citramalate synthase [Anaerolineaceae bacterium]
MIHIYDTTLRDGTQRKGISLSCEDKIRIAQKLDQFGVDFIEGGWPGSNPKDVAFFKRAQELEWQHAKIAAFGATRRANTKPEEDPNLIALVESGAPVCTIFGKTWTLHVTRVMQTTLEENLLMIEESVAFLKAQGRRVIYDAEHFFDGYKADQNYALQTLAAAVRGGAETLVLCDTNGGSLPQEVVEAIRVVRTAHPGQQIGIHAHDDGGMAVANSIAAIQEGCMHIQGTINGYGERCGNANLCTVIPNLEIKLGLPCLPEGSLAQLTDVSHFVSEIANLRPDEHQPFVGKAAFAHKGGIHVSAMRREVTSYQHIDPEWVGNEMLILVSELSGHSNLLSKAEDYGLDEVEKKDVSAVLNEIKELESRGFSFEAAEASVALLLSRQQQDYQPPFEMVDFFVNVEHRQGRIFAEATVKVMVNGQLLHTAAEGNGPVSALDMALRKALTDHYPVIEKFHLADYKVRILDSSNGTNATTRVLIDTQNGSKRWSTVGASPNIIEASWRALVDAIEYGLMAVN